MLGPSIVDGLKSAFGPLKSRESHTMLAFSTIFTRNAQRTIVWGCMFLFLILANCTLVTRLGALLLELLSNLRNHFVITNKPDHSQRAAVVHRAIEKLSEAVKDKNRRSSRLRRYSKLPRQRTNF